MTLLSFEPQPGTTFDSAYEKAVSLIDKSYKRVAFEFNGVVVFLDHVVDKDLVWRDIETAWLLGQKIIGPDYELEYSAEKQALIAEKEGTRRLEREKRAAEWQEKREKSLKAAEGALSLYPFRYQVAQSKYQEYLDWKEVQSGGYGLAAFKLAEYWAALAVQLSSQRNTHIKVVLEEALSIADDSAGGCTGFQYGAAKQILKRYWIYGEFLCGFD